MTMPKYAVVIKQNGEGCDYTIGCGMQTVELKSTTREEALREARMIVQGTPDGDYEYGFADTMLIDYDHTTTSRIQYAKLVQIEEDLPVAQWHAELLAAHRRSQEESTEAKERAEYERLRNKFG